LAGSIIKARFMKGLGQRYVQTINRTYRRTGTLVEGRLRSSVIAADGDPLACQRCIELHPVRARMLQAPGDQPWPSDRCNALGVGDPLVVPHAIDRALAEGEQARRARDPSLCADEIPEGDLTAIREATNGGFALGSARFQRPIAAMVGRRTWPGKSARPRQEAPDDAQLELLI
jgi:putative transposase